MLPVLSPECASRREALQAEPVTVALGDDSQEIKRRRAREKSAQGGVAPLASARTLGPRHVAVIMDGNRRFGRVKYRDPLKVCVSPVAFFAS